MNLKHQGKYAEAMQVFEACLAANPNDELALYGKGWVLAEQGNKQGAADAFSKFLAVSKDKAKIAKVKQALSRLK